MAFLIDLSQASGDKMSVDCTDIVPWGLAMANKAHRFEVKRMFFTHRRQGLCAKTCRGMRIYRRL